MVVVRDKFRESDGGATGVMKSDCAAAADVVAVVAAGVVVVVVVVVLGVVLLLEGGGGRARGLGFELGTSFSAKSVEMPLGKT